MNLTGGKPFNPYNLLNFRRSPARLWLASFVLFLCTCSHLSAQPSTNRPAATEIRIVGLEGVVEISPVGATAWIPIQTAQPIRAFDRLRTGPNSRVTLRWSDQSIVPFGPLTELEILPPEQAQSESGLHLIKGILSFFHRDKPSRIRVITRGAVAGILGTEFVIAVDEIPNSEQTTLWVMDGQVSFTNELGALVLTNGQHAVAEVGQRPVLTAGFIANNILQWCFYYPAVLDLDDLPLSAAEQSDLATSLKAYRDGDLLTALDKYPKGRTPVSASDSLYHAALLLSVGQVEQTEKELSRLESTNPENRILRLATALRTLIAAVKHQDNPSTAAPQLTTEFLAASYYAQSRATRETALLNALDLAKRATTNSPQSGFAWERVAELEFSFGRIGPALQNLNKSLEISPRNAEALALKGLILAAQNRTKQAIVSFNRALEVDPSLGNAWLGRGLCRIHQGDAGGGREDLLVAAALEPQRGLLRSYLGKAYANEGDFKRASKELKLAEKLDPNDPTPWLYSALLKQQQNRINEAITDLEKSESLNDNRSVYRSSLLLDQDRAVRSANLARIYQDAGMVDVSVREASRAVSYDYANYSAHLFLANSYDALRDPNRINLRYETPAESEYLIANLLAPPGAGTLSQAVSQQEYSRLFERDRFGMVSSTEYLSRGAWTEKGAQFGTFGNFAYSFEASYRSDPGQRPNNDLQETELHFQFKQQITPQDSLYFRGIYYDAAGGDLFEYYNQSNASPVFRYDEKQEPVLFLGYHHEWSPGVHTLLLAGHYDDTLNVHDPRELILIKGIFAGEVSSVLPINMNQVYRDTLEIYSIEAQQIWQAPAHATVAGVLWQSGHFELSNFQNMPSAFPDFFNDPPTRQKFRSDFERFNLYGYHLWQIIAPFQLIGGFDYDRLRFPEDFRFAPLSEKKKTMEQWSPKAGFIWTPASNTVIRFAYARSLTGASLDQSFRLEPTQVAGLNQAFRSIAPESVIGANAGARLETFALSLEQKFPTSTYLGITGEILNSNLKRSVGAFELNTDVSDFAFPSTLRENLDFRERSITFTFNQLLGRGWSAGARYRLTDAELSDNFPDVPASANIFDPFHRHQDVEAVLHQIDLNLLFSHPSGFFGRFDAVWYKQSNQGYQPDQPGDQFWQLDIFGGYRFLHRRAEVTLGVLNLTDQNYRLNPLTLYNELPRARTFLARLQLTF